MSISVAAWEKRNSQLDLRLPYPMNNGQDMTWGWLHGHVETLAEYSMGCHL